MSAAQRASTLDPNGKEVKSVLRRTRALSTARSNGNELFKVARYSEACIAYGEGLSHDPYNAVLLCNRAACRSKLGQYEKAIEDCTSALNVRSAYSKARLRRADCYSKVITVISLLFFLGLVIGKWGECIKDCEVLIRENPDEEIERIFKEAKENLGQHNRSRDIVDTSVVVVSSDEHFRDCVTSSRGTSVVLFCNKKTGDRTIMQHMEKLKKRFPSVNFLKVEVEDHPLLAKSEGLKLLPGFIIYTNGSRAKEVPGDNYELLESSIKYLISS
ncbi:PREDICTED: TPR repeat-containing thioredoxin TTL4-like [Erythranthe guttata]|uniref:TPR repeat-containing thioredoxin TTL4-like n=1 Tax=Erythranthe guttata TaxID=4155 RepID=UPI00064D75CD|nr:PREDICTED: TPR repeat-containing thioredoxin TTL4-like [Erythranthe guttata]|eukprot:XP_012844927.1 PREDICTED: TPR repeat-containing thioredoxin TTL4-like [Erythranthe guttata]